MTGRNMLIVIMVVCHVFILSGGINAGFSKFFMAIPFMILAVVVAMKIKSKYAYISLLTIPVSVILSFTLVKNPIVFPILSDGYVEVLSDGYHVTYRGGSGGFFTSKPGGSTVKIVQMKELKKGERYGVNGVKTTHPDFSTDIVLQTTVGEFIQSNYSESSHSKAAIATNKEVHREWISRFSSLMAWPLLFMVGFPIGLLVFFLTLILLIVFIRALPKS